jgi:hypothetical protein
LKTGSKGHLYETASKKKRSIISLLIFLAFLVIVLIPLQFYTTYRLNKERDNLIREIEERHNIEISFENTSSAFLSRFELRNVVIVDKENPENLAVTINRLQFSFNLLALFRRRLSALDLIRSVQLNRVDIKVINIKERTEEQRDYQKIIDELTAGSERAVNEIFDIRALLNDLFLTLENSYEAILPPLFISGKSINIDYTNNLGRFRAGSMIASIMPVDDRLQLSLTAELTADIGELYHIESSANIKGSVTSNLSAGDFQAAVSTIRSNLFSISQQGLRLVWGGGILEARKNIDNIPIDYVIRIDANNRSVYTHFSADRFNLNDFIEVSDANLRDRANFFTFFNGSGSFLYYYNNNLAYYDAEGFFRFNGEEEPIDITVNMAGNNLKSQIKELKLEYNTLSASFSGNIDLTNLFPSGTFRFENEIKPGIFLKTESIFNNYGSYLEINTPRLTVNNTDIATGHTLIAIKDKAYNFNIGFNEADGGTISLAGFYDLPTRSGSLSFDTTGFSFARLADLEIAPAFLTAFTLNSTISGFIENRQFFIEGRSIELKQDENHRFFTAFTLNNSLLSIPTIEAQWGNYAVGLSFISTLGKEPVFSGNFMSQAMYYPFTGSFKDQLLSVAFAYGQLSFAADEKYLKVEIDNMPLVTTEDPLLLNFAAEASFKENIEAQLQYLRVNNSALHTELSRGRFNRSSGRIEQIIYSDGISVLRGSADYRQSDRGYDAFFSIAGSGNEIYRGEFFYTDALKGNVTIENFPLERLGQPELEGLASLNVAITNTDTLEAVGGIGINGYYNNKMLKFNTNFNYDRDALSLTNLSAQYGKWLTYGGIFLADFNEHSLSFSTDIGHFYNFYQTGLSFYIKEKKAEARSSMASFVSNDFSGLIEFDTLKVKGRNMLSLSRLAIDREGAVFRLEGHEGITMNALFNTEEQLFSLNIDNKDTIELHASGNLTPQDFQIEIDSFYFPLQMFNPMLIFQESKRMLGFERGGLNGRLVIAKNMIMNGYLQFDNGILISPFSPGTKLALTDRLTIENNVVSTGSGWLFNVNNNTLRINAEANLTFPDILYTATVEIDGRRGIPFSFDIHNQVKFNGNVTGWTRFQGDRSTGYLSGRLEMPFAQGSLGNLTTLGGNVTRPPDPTIKTVRPGFTLIAGPDRTLNQNYYNGITETFVSASKDSRTDTTGLFTIASGNDFSFYVPNIAIPTLVATLSPGQTANIMLDITKNGDTLSYVEGDLRVYKGEINYFGNTFNIKEGGLIRLNEETSFNPELIFDADLRVSPTSNQIITMHFHNRALDSYNPTFTAEPSMSNNEIMLALGSTFIPSLSNVTAANNSDRLPSFNNEFNNTPDTDDEESSGFQTIVRTSGDFVGEYLSRAAENLLRRIPFIDIVSVKTDFVSNLALDQLQTASSNSSINNNSFGNDNFNVFDYLSGTSIYAGSYIAENFFLQASIGVDKETNTQRYMQENSERLVPTVGLSMQFTTPIFLVEWAFNPNFSSLNSLFTPAVSLSLSKTFTFKNWSDFVNQLKGRSEP